MERVTKRRETGRKSGDAYSAVCLAPFLYDGINMLAKGAGYIELAGEG